MGYALILFIITNYIKVFVYKIIDFIKAGSKKPFFMKSESN